MDKEESIEFEFFGQYFPVIEEDSFQLQMDRKVVITATNHNFPPQNGPTTLVENILGNRLITRPFYTSADTLQERIVAYRA